MKIYIPKVRETKVTEPYRNTPMLDCLFTSNNCPKPGACLYLSINNISIRASTQKIIFSSIYHSLGKFSRYQIDLICLSIYLFILCIIIIHFTCMLKKKKERKPNVCVTRIYMSQIFLTPFYFFQSLFLSVTHLVSRCFCLLFITVKVQQKKKKKKRTEQNIF